MRTQTLTVRGLRCHIQEWGSADLPKLFMLHGWMDCGATFKYMAPYLQSHFHIIAPDLRGFGESEHAADGYWFPDYYADIEMIFDHYSPQRKIDIVGHSMGGNIVLTYAGIRSERVSRVLSLEGIGIPASEPEATTDKLRLWLIQVGRDEPPKVYPNADMLKRSIHKGNPSLPSHVIEDLTGLWAKPLPGDTSGAMLLKHDHRHRQTNPFRYHFEDTLAAWREVSAKVGVVMAADSRIYTQFGVNKRLDEMQAALKIAPEHLYLVEDSNHMLHMEQPETTAQCIIDFFS